MSHRLTAVKILTDNVKQQLISYVFTLTKVQLVSLNFVYELCKYFIRIAFKYLHRCQNNTEHETRTTAAPGG